jgi:hypothetical protein
MKNYIVRKESDWVWVKFSYDADVIDRIKCLDKDKREWDGDNKQWGFDLDLFTQNEAFLFPSTLFKRVDAPPTQSSSRQKTKPPPYTPPPPQRPQAAPSGPWVALWLLPGAPKEVIEAAYRALIRKHHPDVGGDEETAKRINAAYAQLKK